MKLARLMPFAVLLAVTSVSSAALTQVGDFRLQTAAGNAAYDTVSLPTRGVTGAPFQITSTLDGTSQNNDGTVRAADSAGNADRDLSINASNTSATIFNTLNRFAVTPTSAQAAGAVAYTFSLANAASYASANSQTVNQAIIRLSTTTATTDYAYDVYLSYTSAADGLTRTPISTSQTSNYATFFAPGNAANVGDKVNGKFVVLAKDVSAASNLSADVTSLYNAGTTDFTLILVAAKAYGSNRQVSVNANSGVFVDTVAAVPEPAALLGLAVAAPLASRRRRR